MRLIQKYKNNRASGQVIDSIDFVDNEGLPQHSGESRARSEALALSRIIPEDNESGCRIESGMTAELWTLKIFFFRKIF